MRNYLVFFFYICVFISVSLKTKAQYIFIPDANFRAYLESTFPTCMQGGMMDTTCTGITNATTIDVHSKNILDLTGIQYFDHLQELDCHENYIAFLPPLPITLKFLKCYKNILTSLPSLPNILVYLDCSENLLTSLPILPVPLFWLDCGMNQLKTLPVLPDPLIELSCEINQLQTLPVLPGLLQYLDCSENEIINLPPLPSPLLTLSCDKNLLTALPALPASLINLGCVGNQLTALPNLPASLFTLYCGFNNLGVLPPLPSSLLSLSCVEAQLVNLPSLPNKLNFLECDRNVITCLPVLPNSLTMLITDYVCRPNLPPNLTTNMPLNSPFCSAVNFTHTRVCAGDSTRFNLINASCHVFMWNFDDPATGVNNTSTLQSPKHLFSHSGTFNVKLISYATNPATVITKMVTVDKLQHIDFGNDHSMCSDDGITLDAGKGFESYLWQDGLNAQVYKVTTAGTYTVTATNTCGSTTETIHLSDYTLTLPNLFTPNKDGHNETFEVKGLDGDKGLLQVYNSWGAEVYRAENYNNDWNGEELQDGIYYYSFTLKSCPVKKGWIQIIR
ncbi:gliding motility-associated C-terminal domain-containing protein [Cytophaga aurantiaca]|uniref:T9SS type B sorting domain-containing protein n=1 Tax=Cytophaga aurantiaca TaxID=29530 RepID=UPI0003A0FDAB|nr:gliding motility-associated C-terminal domain-containing protein [Cytophaga aurantiaca]